MTLSHEQFQHQLLDYVYGELEGEALTSFEAHLASSEEARMELASMRETLQLARAGLSELEETPPARVHREILALDAAKRAPAEKQSFWAWLRNPAVIAVAGLTTVALLVVVSRRSPLDPKHDFSVPVEQEQKPEPEAEGKSTSMQEEPALPKAERAAPASSGSAIGDDAKTAPARGSASHRERREAAPPSARTIAPAPSAASRAQPAPAAPRKYAEPPPPRASEPRSAEAESGDALRAAPAANGGGAYPNSPSTPSPAAAIGGDSRFAQPPPARAQMAPDDELRVAREHAHNARWNEAARAYRELLRRYPNDPRKAEWQRQLDLMNPAPSR